MMYTKFKIGDVVVEKEDSSFVGKVVAIFESSLCHVKYVAEHTKNGEVRTYYSSSISLKGQTIGHEGELEVVFGPWSYPSGC